MAIEYFDAKETDCANMMVAEEDTETVGSNDVDFEKLLSVIPHLEKETPTKLDIVLEAITYIHSLQRKLMIKI